MRLVLRYPRITVCTRCNRVLGVIVGDDFAHFAMTYRICDVDSLRLRRQAGYPV